jgi:hypothetical protein
MPLLAGRGCSGGRRTCLAPPHCYTAPLGRGRTPWQYDTAPASKRSCWCSRETPRAWVAAGAAAGAAPARSCSWRGARRSGCRGVQARPWRGLQVPGACARYHIGRPRCLGPGQAGSWRRRASGAPGAGAATQPHRQGARACTLGQPSVLAPLSTRS